jgi:hypothetical protein
MWLLATDGDPIENGQHERAVHGQHQLRVNCAASSYAKQLLHNRSRCDEHKPGGHRGSNTDRSMSFRLRVGGHRKYAARGQRKWRLLTVRFSGTYHDSRDAGRPFERADESVDYFERCGGVDLRAVGGLCVHEVHGRILLCSVGRTPQAARNTHHTPYAVDHEYTSCVRDRTLGPKEARQPRIHTRGTLQKRSHT